MEKLNNSSMADIKICEERGFPEPCSIDSLSQEIGYTKFVLSTIKDHKGQIVFYNVVKEKQFEQKHYIEDMETIMVADFHWFDVVTLLVFVFLYICLWAVLAW